MKNRWILPNGMEELLPPHAWEMELLCRRLLNLYRVWGYELVIPPMLEYLESLLVGGGQGLAIKTFKVMDQLNGRTMGLRADMTPQIARIDSWALQRDVPSRLCYLGTTLHTHADTLSASRSPLQTGVELFGCRDISGDIEILRLLTTALQIAGVTSIHIDISHVGIYRHLLQAAGLDEEQQQLLTSLFGSKALPELQDLLRTLSLPVAVREMLLLLASCNGEAKAVLPKLDILVEKFPAVSVYVDELHLLHEELIQHFDQEVCWHYDLAELRNSNYHTGLLFTAYCAGDSSAGIAFGGRYGDDSDLAFGRARPATGFSMNIKQLMAATSFSSTEERLVFKKIYAPAVSDSELDIKIQELRKQGEIVISALREDSSDAHSLGCTHELQQSSNGWQIVAI